MMLPLPSCPLKQQLGLAQVLAPLHTCFMTEYDSEIQVGS